MGFFKSLLNKVEKEISAKTDTLQTSILNNRATDQVILPDVIERSLAPNPYNSKYLNVNEKEAVYLLYCDFASCERWIKDSNKPDVYFESYIKALQILMRISKCSKASLISNNNAQPIAQLNTLRQNYSKNTDVFINRFWKSIYEKANKLKTEKGKANKINSFFNDIEKYKMYLTVENIFLIDTLKNNYYSDNSEALKQTIKTIKAEAPTKCGKYDITSVENIRAIPDMDTTVMKPLQKVATELKRTDNLDLAIECLRKSNSISDHSTDRLKKLSEKDYLRYIKYLEKANKELAEQETMIIHRIHPEFFDKRISNINNINDTIKKCNECNNDLIEIFTNGSCELCSQYDKVIYSISGKNKSYPKLPTEILYQTHKCTKCIMTASVYIDGITNMQ